MNATTSVTGQWVTVERTLEPEAGSIIATVSITSSVDVPVAVEVVDELPASWEVSEVGVHPSFEPAEFDADSTHVTFADIVDPESGLEVVYGVKLPSPQSSEPPAPPIIQRERQLQDIGAAGPDSAAVGGEWDPDRSGPATVEDDGWEADVAEPAADAGDDAGSMADGEPFQFEDEDAALGDATEPSNDAVDPDRIGEAVDESWADSIADDSAGSEADPGDRADGSDAATPALGATATEGGLVAALAAELDADSASDEDVATLRAALSGGAPRRVEARLDHLGSRVEEFAAYSEALGELIDEYGTEGLDELQAGIDDLADEHDAVRTRLDEADDDRDGLRGRLDELDEVRARLDDAADDRNALRERLVDLAAEVDDVADLGDDLDAVRDELRALRRTHGADVDDLEGSVEELSASLDEAVGEVRSDVEGLRGSVDELDDARRSVADALRQAADANRPDEA